MKVPFALVVGATMLVTPAAANHLHIDTETLNDWCRPHEVGTSDGEPQCIGYIKSVADALARGALVHGHRACIPENAPIFYIRTITIRELENRPNKEDHMNARQWAAQVLSEAFPC